MKAHGANVTWVCDQLGHSSVRVTERFYVDGTPAPPPPELVAVR